MYLKKVAIIISSRFLSYAAYNRFLSKRLTLEIFIFLRTGKLLRFYDYIVLCVFIVKNAFRIVEGQI